MPSPDNRISQLRRFPFTLREISDLLDAARWARAHGFRSDDPARLGQLDVAVRMVGGMLEETEERLTEADRVKASPREEALEELLYEARQRTKVAERQLDGARGELARLKQPTWGAPCRHGETR